MLACCMNSKYFLTNPQKEHFSQIQALCLRVYPESKPWNLDQLESHLNYFPDGQLIVVDTETQKLVGLAFSLIIDWNDYLTQDNWKDFTASGYFSNHDPRKGKTLYGAEVMVDPELQGQGIGKILYEGRKQIVKKYNLKRIRAGARLRGYGKYKDRMSPTEYVKQVAEKKIYDPTLSFQIAQGFEVIDVAKNYLTSDPESMGFAGVIEWLNPKLATTKEIEKQKQNQESLFSGNKFATEHLPRELKKLVRQSTYALGDVIKELEGESFFEKIEFYREQLKKTRSKKVKSHLQYLMTQLKAESKSHRQKIAHAFALQLELINVCEAAYRTWRQRHKQVSHVLKSKLSLTYVLTAHPTEARSKETVDCLNEIGKLLLEALQNNFAYSDKSLTSQMRMLWLHPFSKAHSPSVADEAEYIDSLIFSEGLFDFILSDKPSYDLKLRTWVGGDKDGHPLVNKDVMLECLTRSRKHLLRIMISKIEIILSDVTKLEAVGVIKKAEVKGLVELLTSLRSFHKISTNDGTKIKSWKMKFTRHLKSTHPFIKKHNQIFLIQKILEKFPAFVFPIELREDSGLIKLALKDSSSVIREMLTTLKKVSGVLGVTSYARGLIISHCENEADISTAAKLVQLTLGTRVLPVIPLFETQEALISAKGITKSWLSVKQNREIVLRQWNNTFEVMLGYSDSSKQMGVLPSRYLIAKAMTEIEKAVKSLGVHLHFFHGSGGSVARGGGSLQEQIAWWPKSAIAHPKMTIQGEMIQRKFATQEILNSQCVHFAVESMARKNKSVKLSESPELERFVSLVSQSYIRLIQDKPTLQKLLNASPYHYLDLLKIGSRPTKRPGGEVSVESLRAIPWVLCWTQTRLLMPTWWGVGSAWVSLTAEEKKVLISLFSTSPFFSSFIKTLGFTLSKVELEIWQLYFKGESSQALFDQFQKEYNNAVKFTHEVSQQQDLMWHKPWLKESIQLRSANIHILNMLQIISFETNDEALLKESIVGIACGMLTTG